MYLALKGYLLNFLIPKSRSPEPKGRISQNFLPLRDFGMIKQVSLNFFTASRGSEGRDRLWLAKFSSPKSRNPDDRKLRSCFIFIIEIPSIFETCHYGNISIEKWWILRWKYQIRVLKSNGHLRDFGIWPFKNEVPKRVSGRRDSDLFVPKSRKFPPGKW